MIAEDEEQEEHETIDLNTMGPNEAFGLAWSKAIELLKNDYPDASRHLATISGGEPSEGTPPEQENE